MNIRLSAIRFIRQRIRERRISSFKKNNRFDFSDEQVIIHQIYSVGKQTDALNFRSTLSNQRQLFHGSKYNNFLGILSR